MGKSHFWIALLMLSAAFILPGCDSGPIRYSVEGTVTLDGQPLESGSICFRPESGTTGPTAGAEIIAGKFNIPDDVGLLPGRYRVEITACRKGNETFIDDVTGEPTTACVQFLPARYNTKSELREEIKASGANNFSFALQLEEK